MRFLIYNPKQKQNGQPANVKVGNLNYLKQILRVKVGTNCYRTKGRPL